MERLIAAGVTVRLPSVSLDEQTAQVLDVEPGVRESATVTSVDFDRVEEVQCISIDDDDHLYLTDGLIPTHNTNNLIFLKSNDDTMNETLSKMSGVRHVTRRDSKTVTEDMSKIVKGTSVDSKVSYTMSTSEEPLIKQGDLAYLNERNSIVFRAGDMPIWNRNETILPCHGDCSPTPSSCPAKTFHCRPSQHCQQRLSSMCARTSRTSNNF